MPVEIVERLDTPAGSIALSSTLRRHAMYPIATGAQRSCAPCRTEVRTTMPGDGLAGQSAERRQAIARARSSSRNHPFAQRMAQILGFLVDNE